MPLTTIDLPLKPWTQSRCSFPDGGSAGIQTTKQKTPRCRFVVPMTYIFCQISSVLHFASALKEKMSVPPPYLWLEKRWQLTAIGGSSMLVLKTGFGHWLSCGKAENRPSGDETPTTHLMVYDIGSYWGYLGMVYYWGYHIWNGLSNPNYSMTDW